MGMKFENLYLQIWLIVAIYMCALFVIDNELCGSQDFALHHPLSHNSKQTQLTFADEIHKNLQEQIRKFCWSLCVCKILGQCGPTAGPFC